MTLLTTHLRHEIKKIAIVDDDKSEIDMAVWEVEAAGFEPIVIPGKFNKIEALTSCITSNAQAALCDHRLGYSGFANFSGASLVAKLYDLKIPAILITQYADIDNGISIRRWRDKIPVLLSRDKADATSITDGMRDCLNELEGKVSDIRKPHRVLLRIVQTGKEPEGEVIDAFIPSWNPHRAVRFPASIIPDNLKTHIKEGVRFFAQVNIGAEEPNDLYLKDFELATEPDEDEELA